jgi:hypothetical protein
VELGTLLLVYVAHMMRADARRPTRISSLPMDILMYDPGILRSPGLMGRALAKHAEENGGYDVPSQ